MNNSWLLSEKGILTLDGEFVQNIPFQGQPVKSGAQQNGKVALIVDKHNVWLYEKSKWKLSGKTETKLNCLIYSQEGVLLLGTEKARLASFLEGELVFLKSFDEVSGRERWITPWGGPPDVRSIALSPDGTLLYVNVHVGWIVRSTDHGKTWINLSEGLDMDVHQVGAHASDPAQVFAATAKGFYLSEDYGTNFYRNLEGIPYHYQRACSFFDKSNTHVVSTSKGPHGSADGKLFWSNDKGKHWHMCLGLPTQIEKNIDTFQIIPKKKGKGFVIIDDSLLFETEDGGKNWKEKKTQLSKTVWSCAWQFPVRRKNKHVSCSYFY